MSVRKDAATARTNQKTGYKIYSEGGKCRHNPDDAERRNQHQFSGENIEGGKNDQRRGGWANPHDRGVAAEGVA